MAEIKPRILALLQRRGIQATDVTLIAEVGSRATGTGVGADDDDYTVVRMEPWPEFVTAATSRRQSMMIRTQPGGVRSRFGDIDLNVYTLRKFVNLAVKGNPSILGALFSPNPLIQRGRGPMRRLPGIVASKASGNAYLGYVRQQRERWVGERGQKNVSRPELVERYGFDTKYAGHIIRLALQGIEYLSTGKLTLPMPVEHAELVVACRTGQMTEEHALSVADRLETQLRNAFERSPLPESPGVEAANRWVTEMYASWYGVSDVTTAEGE